MTLAVVLLPDTALLVPGVAGSADPLADLRVAALDSLAAELVADRVRVIAPGSQDRDLIGPRASLAAAGVPAALVPDAGTPGAPAADVPASVALLLLAAARCARGVRPAAPAGVPDTVRSDAPVFSGVAQDDPVPVSVLPGSVLPAPVQSGSARPEDVRCAGDGGPPAAVVVTEVDRSVTDAGALRSRGAGLGDGLADESTVDARNRAVVGAAIGAMADAAGGPIGGIVTDAGPEPHELVVVVGSLSARDGQDAPLAGDPRAAAVDDALLVALGAGPAALARALDDLGPLAPVFAVSGWGPWQVLLGLLADRGGAGPTGSREVTAVLRASTAGSALGSHAVAVWHLPFPEPASPTRSAGSSTVPGAREESR